MGVKRKLLMLTKERKLKYVGHALRNKRTGLMTTALQGKVEGERNRGRPPALLARNITEISGKNLQEVARLSNDRYCWRGLVRTTCVESNSVPG